MGYELVAEALSGNVAIQAVHSGKCAEVNGGSTANGAAVLQWSCTARRTKCGR